MSRGRNHKGRKRQPISADPPKSRAELEALHGEVWSTEGLGRTFVVTAIIGATVVVRRKSDDVVGTLQAQQGPPQFFFQFTLQPTAE
jgi:hypothetical protein